MTIFQGVVLHPAANRVNSVAKALLEENGQLYIRSSRWSWVGTLKWGRCQQRRHLQVWWRSSGSSLRGKNGGGSKVCKWATIFSINTSTDMDLSDNWGNFLSSNTVRLINWQTRKFGTEALFLQDGSFVLTLLWRNGVCLSRGPVTEETEHYDWT